MIRKLCLFILLVTFSNSVLAEYYLVYTPPQCVDCVDAFPLPLDYKSPCHKVYKHKKKHYVVRHHKKVKHLSYKAKYKPKVVKVYKQRNTCGECEDCICGPGYAISTSQPEFYGEHCTTYEDEMHGRQAHAGY